jgi:hypothetical protein
MTTEEIERLRRLCEKATPGPWEWYGRSGDAYLVAPKAGGKWIMDDGSAGGEYNPYLKPNDPDAQFIAASREAVPTLLDEVERLRDVLSLVEAELFKCYLFKGYVGGPVNEPATKMALDEAHAALEEALREWERVRG